MGHVKRGTSVPLIGGDYVNIKVYAMHSVHNSLMEDGNAYVFLKWESSEIRKEIIAST